MQMTNQIRIKFIVYSIDKGQIIYILCDCLRVKTVVKEEHSYVSSKKLYDKRRIYLLQWKQLFHEEGQSPLHLIVDLFKSCTN